MKRFTLLSAAFLLAAPAFAQEATPQPPAQPVEPPSKFYLELDKTDLDLIGTAINELPKKIADPLINRLNAQLSAQTQPNIAANRDMALQPQKGKKK